MVMTDYSSISGPRFENEDDNSYDMRLNWSGPGARRRRRRSTLLQSKIVDSKVRILRVET